MVKNIQEKKLEIYLFEIFRIIYYFFFCISQLSFNVMLFLLLFFQINLIVFYHLISICPL